MSHLASIKVAVLYFLTFIYFLISIFLPGTQSTVHARSTSPHSGGSTGSSNGIECAVNPITVSDNGYQLDVYLANTGSNVVKGWKVILSFNEPVQVTGSWNANMFEVSTATVIAGNVHWNRDLLPGQTTSFGLQGTHNGIFSLPTCSASSG